MLATGLLFTLALAAQEGSNTARSPLEHGAVAPPGTWYTTGGNAARTARAWTKPLRQVPREAWRFVAGGTIESEPLLWRDRIFLAVLQEDGRRALEWVDLPSGELVARRVLSSDVSLQPAVWGNVVALRADADTVEFLRVGHDRFTRFGEYEGSRVFSPLLFQGEAYVTDGQTLVRLEPGLTKPRWKAFGSQGGTVALRGQSLYVASSNDGRNIFIYELDRATGEKKDRAFAGPSASTPARLQLLDDAIVIHGSTTAILYPPYLEGRGTKGVPTYPFDSDLVGATSGWIGFAKDEARSLRHVTILDDKRQSAVMLASPERHAEYVQATAQPSRAGAVVMIGALAFDYETREPLWDLGLDVRQRAIPARDALLCVDGDRDLVCLREEESPRAPVHTLVEGSDPEGTSLEDAALVLRDESVVEGDFTLTWNAEDGEGTIRTTRGKRRSWELDDVSVIVGHDDDLLHAVEGDDLRLALEALSRHRAAAAYSDLAHDARMTRDRELMGELVARARALGSEDERLRAVDEKIDDLVKRPPGRIDEKRVARIRERENELKQSEGIWNFVRRLDDDAPRSLRHSALRSTLISGDAPPEAQAAVWDEARLSLERDLVGGEFLRDVLERHVSEGDPSLALRWLDYVEVTARHPVDFLMPPEGERPEMTLTERKLGRATVSWRPDLICVRSEHLRIITPLSDPGALARCIDLGELVCASLEGIFADVAVAERAERPMYLYLYENKKEYLREAAQRIPPSARGKESTAGYYNPSEDLQHIYVPEDSEDFERVLGTYAHELTHNWVTTQCPIFGYGESRLHTSRTPGYWIVEGFADLVEECRFDLDRRQFDPWNPRAGALDAVANASADQLIPWERLLTMTAEACQHLGSEPDQRVPLTWKLGYDFHFSETNLFYRQAAAVCRMLFFSEGGARRSALLEYVGSYYKGLDERVGIESAFGMTPEELGERTVAFARAVVQGEGDAPR